MYGYRPTTRLLALLELLQARGRMTGSEIAGRLEVGERSVRRYVERLREIGIPVEGERGRYGAYVLRPGFRLPPLMFTDEEALGLTLGLLAARRLGLSGVTPAVEGALAKVERVMPVALRERVRDLEETVTPAVAPPATPPTGEVVLKVASAVRGRKRIHLRYRSGHSEETEREVDPYGVVHREGFWYTFGYDHLRGGTRLFRLDRILDVEVLEAGFVRPAGLESQEGVLRTVANLPGDDWSVEVLLGTTLAEAREEVPPMTAALEEVEGGVILRCSTSDLAWMARVLSGLSCQFVVRRPAELREALRHHAAEIRDLAGRIG
ncbi:MAG: YafY family transcriptional regulator [Actinomycetota bacterium]|nr:YafY family transcriptional regulator [Actinomycetota bacterium]